MFQPPTRILWDITSDPKSSQIQMANSESDEAHEATQPHEIHPMGNSCWITSRPQWQQSPYRNFVDHFRSYMRNRSPTTEFNQQI